MKVFQKTFSMAVIGMLFAAPAFAQTPPPQTPAAPAGQKPTPPPAPAAQPPKPFPEGAKIAYVDIQLIASNSAEGKAASAKIQEWEKKKTAELTEKNKAAQALQTKLQQGGNVLNESARAQSEKELQKLQRELTALQEDAQQERQEM